MEEDDIPLPEGSPATPSDPRDPQRLSVSPCVFQQLPATPSASLCLPASSSDSLRLPAFSSVSPCSSATFLAPLPLTSSSSPSSDGFSLASGHLDSPTDSRPWISDLPRCVDEEGIVADTDLVIKDVYWREQSGINRTLQIVRGRFRGPDGEELRGVFIVTSFLYSRANTFFTDDLTLYNMGNPMMAAMATSLASILQNLGSDPGGAAAPAQPEAPPPNPSDPSLPPPPRAEPNLASPRVFGGDFDQGKGFLHQCELLFRHQPSRFVSDEAKVGFITSLLADKALSWAIAAVDLDPRLSSDYSAFRREFKAVFEHPTYESRWGETALRSAYRRGLSEAIKDLIVRDRPSSLNELIALSLQMDERLRELRQERAQRAGGSNRQLSHHTPSAPDFSSTSTAAPPPHIPLLPPAHSSPRAGEEPMQIGRSRLSRQEREQRLRDQLCLYCAETTATSSKSAPSDQKDLLTSRGSTGEPSCDSPTHRATQPPLPRNTLLG
ncbi:Retrotransposon-like protein 1 [Takifugu flavidus]|uniref:Retrotransposon-like protein 1 n=1 Tax=Takifugu flavidus TaxID=433684 RepID=A0A5C6ML81_9TELE|nr:Retrotransposon-like protein 1 [Takifugu flavidus]